jgi:hypothetical protein
VLDIGVGRDKNCCLSLPNSDTLGVGIDVAPDVGRVGREMYARAAPEANINFLRADARTFAVSFRVLRRNYLPPGFALHP